ncbi:MAG: hypothetical protein WD295_06055, partial [Bacteroidota bacterium]
MSGFRQILYAVIPAILLVLIYVYDVIRMTVTVEEEGLSNIRELALVVSFVVMYLFFRNSPLNRSRGAPKDLGRLLMFAFAVIGLSALMSIIPTSSFVEQQGRLLPSNAVTSFIALALSVAVGVLAIVSLMTIRQLLLHKRKKGTKRNLVIVLILMSVSSILMFPAVAKDAGLLSSGFLFLAIAMIVVNSFRQSWIVFLSRREKIYSITYSALLLIGFLVVILLLTNRTFVGRSLESISGPLERF